VAVLASFTVEALQDEKIPRSARFSRGVRVGCCRGTGLRRRPRCGVGRLKVRRTMVVQTRPSTPGCPASTATSRARGDGRILGRRRSSTILERSFHVHGHVRRRTRRWGAATDLIYLDLGGSKRRCQDFTVGDAILAWHWRPAHASLTSRAVLWTLDGTYVVVEDPDHPVKLLTGARDVRHDTDLSGKLEGEFSGVTASRDCEGSGEASGHSLGRDVGREGQGRGSATTGNVRPYYLDAGTGDSDLTGRQCSGAGYAFGLGRPGRGLALPRLQHPSGESIEDLNSQAPRSAHVHF